MVGPSKSRPPMSHRKTDLGIPCRSKSAKVVLALLWQIYSRRGSLQIHFRQCGHRCGGSRAKSSRMAWRTAGRVGWRGGPLILFFPPCCCEAAMLEEGVSDHRHERMTVKALPGSSLEVIETEFFFQLLVSLLARQMLLALVPNSLWWSVRYAHTDGGETSLELSLRASAPTDVLPCGVGQHVFGRHR